VTRQVAILAFAITAIVVPAYLFMAWTGSAYILFVLVVSLSFGFVLGASFRAPEPLLAAAITAVWLVYVAVAIALPETGREPVPDVVAAAVGALFAAPILAGSFIGARLGRRVRRLDG